MDTKVCTNCEKEKDVDDFYFRQGSERRHAWCKTCFNQKTGKRVSQRRRDIKEILVEECGSTCVDCSTEYPPYMMDFDHRDPSEKSFTISASTVLGINRLREEVKKCDLVCSNCHRERTHRQRCPGCKYCTGM